VVICAICVKTNAVQLSNSDEIRYFNDCFFKYNFKRKIWLFLFPN
jgi:hypothetical protein